MSETTPEWTPPATPTEEAPGDPGADAGPPMALGETASTVLPTARESYSARADKALDAAAGLAGHALGGNVAAAAVMHSFAAVGQAFATLQLAEETAKARIRTENERA